MSPADRVERCAKGSELVGVQRVLDATEQRSFLMAYVVSQRLAEGVERRDVNVPAGLEVGDAASDVDVLDEDAHDIRIVGSGVTREGRQEHFLFEAEVLATLLVPEVERRVPDGFRIGIGRALQAQSEFERHMVLAREHSQFVGSLHGLDRTLAGE